MALANAHGGRGERIDRTIQEEEVDLSEHDHYTAALLQSGLMLVESYPPRFRREGEGRTLAESEGQSLTLSLEATGLTVTHLQPTRGRRTNAR